MRALAAAAVSGYARTAVARRQEYSVEVALPPVAIDCGSQLRWRDTWCPSDLVGSNEIRAMATEHDFLQFFWTVYAGGQQLDMADLYGIFKSTCNDRACLSGDDTCDKCSATSDRVRWAPVTVTDPSLNGEASLSDGAGLYCDERFGLNSMQLTDFRAAGVSHGITPGTIPP